MAKYTSANLLELLDLLVLHQQKLNKLFATGHFRNKKYLRQRRTIAHIQNAIKSITDRPATGIKSDYD